MPQHNKKVTTSCGNVQGSNSFWNSSTDHAWKKFTAEGSATGLPTTGMCKQKTKLIIFTLILVWYTLIITRTPCLSEWMKKLEEIIEWQGHK